MFNSTIYCWTPKGKFTRVYVAFRTPCEPRAAGDKEAIWGRIKLAYYNIAEDSVFPYWDTPEEEAAERATWFDSWDLLECWEPHHSGIAIDSHF